MNSKLVETDPTTHYKVATIGLVNWIYSGISIIGMIPLFHFTVCRANLYNRIKQQLEWISQQLRCNEEFMTCSNNEAIVSISFIVAQTVINLIDIYMWQNTVTFTILWFTGLPKIIVYIIFILIESHFVSLVKYQQFLFQSINERLQVKKY
jgi:hypothetical protein